jgi:Domain of unknown function (DUF6438)
MRIYICCLLLGLWGSLRANEIDQLRTKEDVNKFLLRKVDESYSHMLPFDGKAGTPGTALSDSFFKADLDNNGLTDLVINGRYLIVIMDLGKEGYRVRFSGGRYLGGFSLDLVAIDSTGSPRKLMIRQYKDEVHPQSDTLVCEAQAFLEYNPAPDPNFRFQGIRFRAGGCYGTCPVFELSVQANGAAVYDAIEYNQQKGKRTGTIPPEEMTKLTRILQYIRWDRLDSSYAVDWTDDRTLTLEIDYNGVHKRIRDYGGRGTYGLFRVYSVLSHFREVGKWHE